MRDDRTIFVGKTSEGPADGGIPAGQPVKLPVEELLTGRAFATGKSGSGKSNTGGVICEQLLANDHPLLVVDIEGEYYSLKERFEVLHVGADEEVDLRVGPEHAEKLATLALEKRVPIVLDVSGFLDEDVRDELVHDVVRQLFAKEKSLRDPFLLVVEEIHEFVPEGGALADVGKMLVRVAKRGRKRGLGILGMSQRPANVKKDYITQADWLVWHRLTWSNDTKVVRRVLDSDYEDAVEDLADGEAFLQADFTEPAVRRVQFRRKETFDAGATPSLDDVDRPELKSISGDLVDELEEISAAADRREDELETLRNEVDTLKDELDEKDERIERLLDLREMVDSVDGLASDADDTVAVEFDGATFDVPEVIQAEVLEVREEKRELENDLKDVRAERDRLAERVEDLENELAKQDTAEELESLRDDVIELIQRHPEKLDAETGGRVEKLESEIRELREERDKLARQVKDEFGDVDDLLAHETVRERLESVADDSRYADTHTWGAVTALAGTEWIEKSAVAPYLDIGESSTGDVLRELAESGLVEDRAEGRGTEYRLDREALQSIVDAHRKQKRLESKREDLRTGGESRE